MAAAPLRPMMAGPMEPPRVFMFSTETPNPFSPPGVESWGRCDLYCWDGDLRRGSCDVCGRPGICYPIDICRVCLGPSCGLAILPSIEVPGESGLFTTPRRMFGPGERIAEYFGEPLTSAGLAARYPLPEMPAPYVVQFAHGQAVDAALVRGVGAFANTSADPARLNASIILDPERLELAVIATKPIPPNTEILANYGGRFDLNKQLTPFVAADGCKYRCSWVTDTVEELGEDSEEESSTADETEMSTEPDSDAMDSGWGPAALPDDDPDL